MAESTILSDFGIDLLEEEIDDVIFQTNEFLCDATFTGSQGPFWWLSIATFSLTIKRNDIQILTSLSGVTLFSDGTKTGQKLQKSNPAKSYAKVTISNNSLSECKGTILSRNKRRNPHKSFTLTSFLTFLYQTKVESDNATLPLSCFIHLRADRV